jgi:hypothetical protein
MHTPLIAELRFLPEVGPSTLVKRLSVLASTCGVTATTDAFLPIEYLPDVLSDSLRDSLSMAGWPTYMVALLRSVALGSNGLVCLFSGHEKYCHNGGMALAHHHGGLAAGVPARGVRDRHHGPRRGPQEAAYLQGKMLGCPRFAPFGGSDGLVCLFLQTREVLPQRGHGLRTPTALAARGPRWRSWSLPADP